MRRMGRKELTVELQDPIAAIPPALTPYQLTLGDDGLSLTYSYDRTAKRTGIVSLLRALSEEGITLRDLQTRQQLARGHLRRPGEGRGMNWLAVRSIYKYEMARTFRTLFQSLVAPVVSTSLYFVVFGTAIGSRIETVEGVALRRLHRARPHHADRADAVDLQRLLRHLLPEVHRHDLRDPLRARLLPRDRRRLRRRGGDEVLLHRPHHLRHRQPLRRAAGGAPPRRPRLPRPHLHQLQPLRLHHRHLGEELRAAPARAAPRRLAAGLPRRRLLLDLHAAARSGRRSPSSTRSSTSSPASAGPSSRPPTSASASASPPSSSSPSPASPPSGGSSAPAGASAPRRHPPPPRRAARARSSRPRRPRGAPAGVAQPVALGGGQLDATAGRQASRHK